MSDDFDPDLFEMPPETRAEPETKSPSSAQTPRSETPPRKEPPARSAMSARTARSARSARTARVREPRPAFDWRLSERTPGYIVAGFLVLIGLPLVFTVWTRIPLVSGANWAIHEAGHAIFGIFGRFLGIAGGTLFQLMLPAGAIVSFWRSGQRLSACIGLWWLGLNLVDVAIYMDDAKARALPLVNFGGMVDKSGHDWYNLLNTFGILNWCHFLSDLTHLLASLAILAGIAFAATPPGWLLCHGRQLIRR